MALHTSVDVLCVFMKHAWLGFTSLLHSLAYLWPPDVGRKDPPDVSAFESFNKYCCSALFRM